MNSGVLLINLEGTVLSVAEKVILEQPAVAGVLLFSKNYESVPQLQTLTRDIKSVRPDLLICADHEGGLVQRFREGFTRLPAAAKFAELYQDNPEQALELAGDTGWLMASELLACGVDLSLAPVVDLDLGKNSVIGSRAFGSEPEQVIRLARAWLDGVHETGMSTVLKHFPGHGSVDHDSHKVLPVDSRPYNDIFNLDMKPFRELLSKVEAVIPAHIVFSEVDEKPAGFSSIWLDGILREKLNFGGLVISDCLTMEGAASAGSYFERVERALAAGCDLLILSNRQGVEEVLAQKELSLRGVGPGRLLTPIDSDWDSLTASVRHKSVVKRLTELM